MRALAFFVLLLVPVAVPLALAIRAWPRDRVRLGAIRQRLGWTAVALTTAAAVFLAVFFVRAAVALPRATFPETVHDWALTAGRISLWLATAALPLSAAGIGRSRLYGLLATVLAWCLCLFMLAGLTAY
jgi:hypothetical protein